MKFSRPALFLALLLMLPGCASTGTGSRWYAPATWFSHAPAGRVDKADARVDFAKEDVVKAAQKLVHETTEALAVAPDSRPVQVAKASAGSAQGLLDQAAGPLTSAELTAIRVQIAGLLSDNARLRAEAEARRQDEADKIGKISGKLAEAVRDSQTANDKLRAAFDKENALANQLRSQRALLVITGALAVLAMVGYAYVRYALGGVPMALGRALAHADRESPQMGSDMRSILDTFLNRNEQAAVKAAVNKVSQ